MDRKPRVYLTRGNQRKPYPSNIYPSWDSDLDILRLFGLQYLTDVSDL